MQHRGVLRAVAVVLTVFAVLSAATGIDQAYGEYATIGSLFGQDTYREADLTGMAKRSDLISVTQWKQEKADGSVSNIPAHGEVRKVNIPAQHRISKRERRWYICRLQRLPQPNTSRRCRSY